MPQLVLHEARGEPMEGMIAVAEVVLNRVQIQYRGRRTIQQILSEPNQFQSFDPNHLRIPETGSEEVEFERAWRATLIALDKHVRLVPGATHFLNPDKGKPAWYDPAKVVARYGKHEFLAGVD